MRCVRCHHHPCPRHRPALLLQPRRPDRRIVRDKTHQEAERVAIRSTQLMSDCRVPSAQKEQRFAGGQRARSWLVGGGSDISAICLMILVRSPRGPDARQEAQVPPSRTAH
jgi:hypothetical protein